MMSTDAVSYCGFVSVVGWPNAGKSTLMNVLVGEEVAITCRKAQTTRFPIQGILTQGETQIIFVDTPGLLGAQRNRLQKSMHQATESALLSADVFLVVVDAASHVPPGMDTFLERLKTRGCPLWIVLNKVDAVEKPSLLTLAERFRSWTEKIFMVSALKRDGLDVLLSALHKAMPKGPWLFPAEMLSTLPEHLWCSEITREVILDAVHQEVPHELYVETELFERLPNEKGLKISQIIHVMKDSQKKIILGKDGSMVKRISMRARERMTKTLGTEVHLFLHVKCTPAWENKRAYYALHGLSYPSDTKG
jgi:GTP-binding protein Era